MWYMWRKRLAHDPSQQIQQVIISDQSFLTYDNKEIYTSIRESLVGKNYRKFMFNEYRPFEKNIFSEYPLISEVRVSSLRPEDQAVLVDVLFHAPELTFSNAERQRIVRENNTYPIGTSDLLNENTTKLTLPSYTDTYDALDGIFYKIHSDTLEIFIEKIHDILWREDISSIEYDPGWEKLHVEYKTQLLLFHLDKSIDGQLAKLLDIKQYYSTYQDVTKLDMWSSDHIIVK